MTASPATAALALPGDDAWLDARLARPGGLSALAPGEAAMFTRAAAAAPAARVVALTAGAAPGDAVALAEAWLPAHAGAPEAFAVWFNLGVARMRLGRAASAADAYRAALALRPDLHEASVNLGLALEAAGDRGAALATWRRALPGPEQRRTLHNHLGRLLEEQGRYAEAAAELRASLLIEPAQPDVMQHYTHLRQRMAAWPVVDPELPGVPPEALAAHCGPLGALALHEEPAAQRAVAEAWIARKTEPAPARLAPLRGYAHERLRIGYLSSDFCRHAMSYLIAEALERHDRARFEVRGYCASPEDGSEQRARVLAAFDAWTPIGGMDDEAAARRIRADEIDVLIDLNGLTKGARLGVLRWKPAPVQVTYLGYIGPVPLPELDWFLCDAYTVPAAAETDYAPRPLRIEGCYQANDGRPPVLPPVSRAEEGLPAEAFVFCCFSHHYKITPKIFEAWIAIVERSPGSVLWLVEDGPASRAALTGRWTARGLAPERLIFAPRVDPARYRARMALGDLFLDTSPYNAGTIASDALRMGLPLITLEGKAFSARMAGSLLTAAGLGELIAPDLEAYVALAAGLAGGGDGRLAAARAHLAGGAWERTLGDAAAFTRRLEAALESVALRG